MTQEKALALMKSGKNIFLTGQAGAGKTYILNQYIQYLRERKVGVAITASTGIAATHMNGQTIHAWSGIGIKDALTRKHMASLQEKKYFTDKIERAKVLIIDEISMLHKNQLDMVNQMLRFFKDPLAPFGGMQVIVSGDFYQLPPVNRHQEKTSQLFAFMSSSWLEANFTVCYLTEQHRQQQDPLLDILNALRNQNLQDDHFSLLENSKNQESTKDPTLLYTHNVDVDTENQKRLNALHTESKTYKAKTKGNKKLVEMLQKSVLTDASLTLKVGAKVMFIKNNYELRYMNGTVGEIVEFNEEGKPVVRTTDDVIIEVDTETWAIEDENGKHLASFTQMPLRLAWAITVHKSQGMTLDSSQMDLRKCFEPGQGYVALSRVKSIKGLFLLGWNDTALQMDSLARKADARFQELSEEADTKFSLEELQTQFNSFIEYCDGDINPQNIKKQQSKLSKKSTYDITRELLEQGLNLEEIAEERGLKKVTLYSHLAKIKQSHPDIDIEHLRPDEKLIQQLQKAITETNYNEHRSKKALFEFLEEKVSYEDISLGLIFV